MCIQVPAYKSAGVYIRAMICMLCVCACGRAYYMQACACVSQCTSGLRLWHLRRKVAGKRRKRLQLTLERALLETLDPWKRERLVAELELQKELGGLRGTLFSLFFGIEQKPSDIYEVSDVTRTTMLLFCWSYIAFLSWYTLKLITVMEQRAALMCMTVWLTSFFTQQFFTQPASLLVTKVLLPALLVCAFVSPLLRRKKRRAAGSKAAPERAQGMNGAAGARR